MNNRRKFLAAGGALALSALTRAQADQQPVTQLSSVRLTLDSSSATDCAAGC
jgi:hypothetical protein